MEDTAVHFIPKIRYMSGKLLVKQVEKFQQNRMEIARAIVKGIGVNIYEVLYHYYKHDKKEVKQTTDWIRKEFYPAVQKAENIKSSNVIRRRSLDAVLQ